MRAIFLPLASLPLSEWVLQNRAAHLLFCSSGFSISGWSRSVLPKSSGRRRIETLIFAALSSSPEVDEWIDKLPDKKKPIYSHSLPCIEAWLNQLRVSLSQRRPVSLFAFEQRAGPDFWWPGPIPQRGISPNPLSTQESRVASVSRAIACCTTENAVCAY
ncbi:hypothetical protein EJ110_NYTH33476 [Nymphaea thermarum]|nr:hypothetical protein EJ110_NYTH33476 [Nymphaea thermarum]